MAASVIRLLHCRFSRHAVGGGDDLAAIEQRLAGEDLRPYGTVRLTTTDTLVELVTPVLATLRDQHPEITVDLVIANSVFILTTRR